MHLNTALLLLPTALALPSLQPRNTYGQAAKAAYFLEDNPSGSSIVALHIAEDGTLFDPVRTSTHGLGSVSVNGTGSPDALDPLGSQSSVFISGDSLFTVNAGSNTVVMFRINPEDTCSPQMIGEPADTLGDFPMSVAYSPEMQMACVLNGGAKAGVTCFHADPFHGLKAMGGLRHLSSSIIDETTPPSGPPDSAAQVLINERGVFAIFKGNAGSTPKKVASIVSYAIEEGKVSTTPILTHISDMYMDFGSTFLSENRLVVVDPSYGASILTLENNLMFKEEVHTVVKAQKAICWSAVDVSLNTFYGIDAAENTIYKFSTGTGALTGTISVKTDGVAADDGMFDPAVDPVRNIIYVLAAANGIVVADLRADKQMQYLDLSSFGERQYYTGMALYF